MQIRGMQLAGVLLLIISTVAAGDVQLPNPQTSGGAPVFEEISNRASALGNAFPDGDISDAELSTILWAASGLNRPDKGWTIPLGMSSEPYARIYVADARGVFLYSWRDHVLKEITNEDCRAKISPQPFSKTAPVILIFVSDHAPLKKINRMSELWDEWIAVAVGAMTQNIYLAADALDIGVRYAAIMNRDVVHDILSIPDGEHAVCIMPMGKR